LTDWETLKRKYLGKSAGRPDLRVLAFANPRCPLTGPLAIHFGSESCRSTTDSSRPRSDIRHRRRNRDSRCLSHAHLQNLLNMSNSESLQGPTRIRTWFSGAHFFAWFVFVTTVYISDELNRVFKLWFLVVPLVAIPALIAITTSLFGLVATIWARRSDRLVSVVGAPVLTVGFLQRRSTTR
jgi:hypothetical protein